MDDINGQVTQENINTEFVLNFLEKFSFEIQHTTFVILDSSLIHKTKGIKREKKFLLLAAISQLTHYMKEKDYGSTPQ